MIIEFNGHNICEIELNNTRYQINVQRMDLSPRGNGVSAVFINDPRISVEFPLEYLVVDGVKIGDG